MKKILLPLLFFVSQLVNSQSQWRPIGADDFNSASYGKTSGSAYSPDQKLIVKNGIAYSMNLENPTNAGFSYWLVLGKYSNGNWEHIDTPFITTNLSMAQNFSFAVDNNNIPYLLLNDPLNDFKATVKKFDGNAWVTVGGAPISTTGSSTLLHIVIGTDGLPFVLYQENGAVRAKKFNGTDWTLIPTGSLQGLTIANVKMDSNNVPYVLYSYSTGGNYFTLLKKFNGTAWEEIGITDFPGNLIDMCLDSNNLPYIVLGDRTLRKFNGVSWETIALPSDLYSSSTLYVGYVSMAIDSDNTLHLGYQKGNYTFDKSIRKLVGGVWQLVSDIDSRAISIFIEGNTLYEEHARRDLFSPTVQRRVGSSWVKLGQDSEMPYYYNLSTTYNNHSYQDLSIRNGVPVASFKNLSQKLSVKEFVSGAWSYVGNTSVSEGYNSNSKIQTDSNGTTYVAYTNLANTTDTNSNITVKKRVGNNWELVGPLNFSLSSETKMDFKINHQNVPYVVYKSGRVQKFNGTSWEFVGGSAYAGEKDVALIFDNNDLPYLIFNSPLTVERFNGTAWEEVGTAALAGYQAFCPQIACDTNNNILIAFVDIDKNVHVLKWDGNTWQQLGTTIQTNVSYIWNSFLKLTVDKNGVPFIMFNKNDNNFRDMANVFRYNGTTWEVLGGPDFSAGEALEGAIVFSETNIPVVVYTSHNLGGLYCKFYGEAGAPLIIKDEQTITAKQLDIAPNPTSSTFSIDIDDEIQTVNIFDLTGKKVLSDIGKKEIDISALQSGLYLIKVKTDTGEYTGKVVKQ